MRRFGIVWLIMLPALSGVGDETGVILNIDSSRNNNSSPVTRAFDPGLYRVLPVGRDQGGSYEAYMLSSSNPRSWVHDYSVASGEFPEFRRWDGQLHASAAEALQNALASTFTLERRTSVSFFISDQALGDNVGGVSLLVVRGDTFRRGDVNSDGQRNVADPVRLLAWLFTGGTISCLDAADGDDDGDVDVSDAIGLLGYLFLGTFPPASPFAECSFDPSEDDLECEAFPPCE